jgi:hypothetical protein
VRVATFAILALCFVSRTTPAADERVKLLIAPRSLEVPSSGKVVLDVYWHNWSDRPARIPSLDTYLVLCSIIVKGHEGGEARGTGLTVDHPASDRPIAPHAVIHDVITAQVELRRKEIGQVSLSVTGEHHKKFESNTVVFTRR